jgi:hypothetical protein
MREAMTVMNKCRSEDVEFTYALSRANEFLEEGTLGRQLSKEAGTTSAGLEARLPQYVRAEVL